MVEFWNLPHSVYVVQGDYGTCENTMECVVDLSGVQATFTVLPSTSVKSSGSDNHNHKKKSKSSKKSALPATSLVGVESKTSSDPVDQLLMPGLGTQSFQPTYAEIVKTSGNQSDLKTEFPIFMYCQA